MSFGVIGVEHDHIYAMVDGLTEGGADLVGFSAESDATRTAFQRRYGKPVMATEAVLDLPGVSLIVTAATPLRRAEIGIAAMSHGHDVLSAKPGIISLEALEQVRKAEQSTGRRFMIWYSERLASPATLRAIDLTHQGAIGEVVQVMGLGPHRLDRERRPDWFMHPHLAGGILTDLASHQTDQFLHFTRCRSVTVASSATANHANADFPQFNDYGEISLVGGKARGFARVDWLSPEGLGAWGDSRTLVTGTTGYLEVRRTIDLAGRPGGDHLFIVDRSGLTYLDCSAQPRPFFADLTSDISDRTDTAGDSATGLLAAELAIRAQMNADAPGDC